MTIDRRSFLKIGGVSLLGTAVPGRVPVFAETAPSQARKADYTVEIANGLAELGPDQIISTTLYNGQFPGPLLRFREGQEVTVEIRNNTSRPKG